MIKMNESTIEKDLKINFWRQHIMEGLLKALKMPDEIKKTLNKNNAKMVLIEKFGFSPKQAQSLLDLRRRPIDDIEEQSILNELSALKEIELKLKMQLS
jgi:DNA gyrase/topoisomerase IV subunit A